MRVRALYALLVGINDYPAALGPLRGCRNDVESARDFLRSRHDPGTAVHIRELCDAEATRAAIIDGWRSHLGRARADDSALFWFSGHGSDAPVPDELSYLEPTGRLQTLVCVDSRRDGTPDLLDKELSLLIGEVAAEGAHVAVVLDCCHSGGGTRDPTVRAVRGPSTPFPVADLLPDLPARLRGRAVAEAAGGRWSGTDHVALSACGHDEAARELRRRGRKVGIFSHELLAAIQRLGPTASYRQLLAQARCGVENIVPDQVPRLYPAAGDAADQPFLGGHVLARETAVTMRHGRHGWEIDIGACHGLVSSADDPVEVAAHGADPVRPARVTRVLAASSLVEPAGWSPVVAELYPVVLSRVPLPPTTVVIGAEPTDDQPTARLVRSALRSANPHGGPSPHVRPVDAHPVDAHPIDAHSSDGHSSDGHPVDAHPVDAHPVDANSSGGHSAKAHPVAMHPAHPAGENGGGPVADLRVATPEPGLIRILDADGAPLVPDIRDADGHGARRAVADLEHIARWRLVKTLANPLSGLANAVTVELVEPPPATPPSARPGDATTLLGRPALRGDPDGTIRLAYRRTHSGWAPPTVFIRIHNRAGTDLYCVLLDLTDRFRIHEELFPGETIGAGRVAVALGGQPVQFSLPAGRDEAPGASARDWLKLLVAERPFSSTPFALPAIGEPLTRAGPPVAFTGLLDRLGWTMLTRGASPGEPPAAQDWTTSIVRVHTVVPDHH